MEEMLAAGTLIQISKKLNLYIIGALLPTCGLS
jgi:hypothetical protein